MATKTDYHHGNLRHALLDAAIEIVAEQGHEALTTKALSQRVGASGPALYRHYRNRSDLLLAVVADAMRILFRNMRRAVYTASPGDRLSALAEAIIDFGQTQPEMYRLMNEADLDQPADHGSDAARYMRLIDGFIDRTLLQQNPGLDPPGLRHQSLLMWFTLYGYISVRRDQPLRSKPKSVEDRVLRGRVVAAATGRARPADAARIRALEQEIAALKGAAGRA